jgi:hypothetical protein
VYVCMHGCMCVWLHARMHVCMYNVNLRARKRTLCGVLTSFNSPWTQSCRAGHLAMSPQVLKASRTLPIL